MILNTRVKTVLVWFLLGLAVILWAVFSGRFILPQSFSFGPGSVHYYGLILALAVASGFYLAKKRAARFAIDLKTADDVIFWLVVGGFIGARVYHVLSSFGYYRDHAIDILKVWNGGLSIYGAVIGGFGVVFFLATRYALRATRLLNWLTPPLILGQIIGRFGNLFNYEAFGYPTNLPWKMFVPENFRPLMRQNSQFFHPWFLYEQIGLLIIFVIIRKFEQPAFVKASAAKSGNQNLFLWYFLLYNTLRFGLEFSRIDSTFINQFRLNSIVSLACILAAAIILQFRKND